MPFVCDYLCLCCVVFGVVLVDFRLFDLGVSLVIEKGIEWNKRNRKAGRCSDMFPGLLRMFW